MTGLELLEQEMIKRGCTVQQTQAKIIPIILGIIAGGGNEYINLARVADDIKTEKNRLERLRKETKWEIEIQQENEKRYKTEIEKYQKQVEPLVQEFMTALNSCETPEGKDALRMAQMFVNSVTVDSKYDNTAFIIGLAAILSRGAFEPMQELKKINTKLPAAPSMNEWIEDTRIKRKRI